PASRRRRPRCGWRPSLRGPGGANREPEPHAGTAPGRTRDLGQVGGTVEPLEPVAQVAEPDAVLVHALQGGGRHAEAVVADAELEAAVGQDGLDVHRAAAQLAERPCFTAFSTSGWR